MIRKVKFSNFYSFESEQEIDFTANKKKTFDYNESLFGGQVSKVAGFIGGNASGKTNLMRLFSFFGYFVSRDVKDNLKDISYQSFFNNSKSSSFFIEFEINDLLYRYNFSINQNKILDESLEVKGLYPRARFVSVFIRDENRVNKINNKYFKKIRLDSLPDVRGDISFISFINKSQYSVKVIDDVYKFFARFSTNVNERGEINNIIHQTDALNIYLSDKDIKEIAEKFIKNFDLGLSGFEIVEKERDSDKITVSVNGLHSTKEITHKIDIRYESRGTRSVFFALAHVLRALKYNSVVIIDEIEAGFHPEALNKLISYFVEENRNKSAQLIFSSHSFGFMSKMDMHQIYLTDKKEDGATSVFRLNEVEGVRTDENYFSRYMSGAYGAFPDIRV